MVNFPNTIGLHFSEKLEERGLELAEKDLLEGNMSVASRYQWGLPLVLLSVLRCSRQPPCSSLEAVLEVTLQDEKSFSLTRAPKPAIAVGD